MNSKVLFLIPAALAFLTPSKADAYVGFRLNLAVPLFFPAYGYYYPAAGYTRNVAYSAPLSAEGEQVTVAPGPGYVWIAGHWSNSAQRWVWVAGHWELPPSPSALWVAGHWVQANGGWIWANDTWTVGNPAQPQTPPSPPAAPASSSAQPPGLPPQAPEPAFAPSPSTPPPPAPEMEEGTIVNDAPPPPVAEYVPASPYPDYLWIGGYWGWHGGWYWTAGHFSPRPRHGALWVSGGWARVGAGWAWHGGRWR